VQSVSESRTLSGSLSKELEPPRANAGTARRRRRCKETGLDAMFGEVLYIDKWLCVYLAVGKVLGRTMCRGVRVASGCEGALLPVLHLFSYLFVIVSNR